MSAPHPLAISVSPSKFILPKGMLALREHVTVTNAGTLPITVHSAPMTVLQSAGGCGVSAANPHWMTISDIGTLQPGQHKTATVTIHAPAGTDADVAAVFSGQAKGQHVTGGTVDASVGSQFVINGTGTVVAPVCHHHATAAPKASGGISVPLAIGLIVMCLAVVAVALWRTVQLHRMTGPPAG